MGLSGLMNWREGGWVAGVRPPATLLMTGRQAEDADFRPVAGLAGIRLAKNEQRESDRIPAAVAALGRTAGPVGPDARIHPCPLAGGLPCVETDR